MAFTRLSFPAMDWQTGAATPLERRKGAPGEPCALLEFAPGFEDPSWCRRGHCGLVLEGSLVFELEGGRVELSSGEAFVLEAGTPHRAGNPATATCRVFIVSPG